MTDWGQQGIGPLRGYFHVILRGPDGQIQDERSFPNLIVTTGKEMLAGILTGGATPLCRNVGIGTGTTTPAANQTALVTEVGARVSAGFALTATTAYYSALFTANNPAAEQTIAEYALFSLAPTGSGYMFVRGTAAGIVKPTANVLEVQYRIPIT